MNGKFVAGRPCIELSVPGSSAPLILQIDTFGDYPIALPAHIASQLNYRAMFAYANHRLLDGRVITIRRGEIDIVVPNQLAPLAVKIRIFQHFNVVGYPGRIDGYVGEEFLKNYLLTIDYPGVTVTVA